MGEKLVEIAFLRNHLLTNLYREEDERLLNLIKHQLGNVDSPFKDVSMLAIANCEKDIADGNLQSAANEINLIHNFHFLNPSKWDSNHFYRFELPRYLDKINDASRIKKLIHELAKLQNNFDRLIS